MASDFPNRGDALFGRQPDIAVLLERSQFSGLTAVTGRARIGKSWTLGELARRLSQRDTGLLTSTFHLVGFAESRGEPSDLFLRAVEDLYTRWLAGSSAVDQARALAFLKREDVPASIGKITGTLAKLITKVGSKPMETAGALVGEWMDALARLDSELKTGGIQLPRLNSDQAQALLTLLHRLTGRPLALVFDQWELSPGFRSEVSIFRFFLNHHEGWPPCHIYVGLRAQDEPWQALQSLLQDFRRRAAQYELPTMHLEAPQQRAALLQQVRDAVPSSAQATDESLLDMIAGYPCVLSDWLDPINARRLRDPAELRILAEEANANRFAELTRALEEIAQSGGEAELTLTMNFVLIPSASDGDYWKSLSNVVLDGYTPRLIDSLRRKGVLDPLHVQGDPPTLGHAKRYEAAFNWFSLNASEAFRERTTLMAVALANRIRHFVLSEMPYSYALAGLLSASRELHSSQLTQALCEASLALFRSISLEALGHLTQHTLLQVDDAVAPLLAMGLVTSMNTVGEGGCNDVLDALLSELRAIARIQPENPTLRKIYAEGVFNCLNSAKSADDTHRRHALLEELRQIYSRSGGDLVLEPFARGLVVAFNQSRSINDSQSKDVFFAELTSLLGVHEQEASLREKVVKVFFVTLLDAIREDDVCRRGSMVFGIRSLYSKYPGDAAMREWLARALFNDLNGPNRSNDTTAMFDELLSLDIGNPQDFSVRRWIGDSLFNLIESCETENFRRRDSLLDSFRQLAAKYPGDVAFRARFSSALFIAIESEKTEGSLSRRNALRQELRKLASAYPEEVGVQEQLLMALFNYFIDAESEHDVARRAGLLPELQQLLTANPESQVAQDTARRLSRMSSSRNDSPVYEVGKVDP